MKQASSKGTNNKYRLAKYLCVTPDSKQQQTNYIRVATNISFFVLTNRKKNGIVCFSIDR
jgi:6-phosphogluconolactonase (cycloisomerase 2 family)